MEMYSSGEEIALEKRQVGKTGARVRPPPSPFYAPAFSPGAVCGSTMHTAALQMRFPAGRIWIYAKAAEKFQPDKDRGQ